MEPSDARNSPLEVEIGSSGEMLFLGIFFGDLRLDIEFFLLVDEN